LSKGRRDRRRAHDALQPLHLVKCKQCGSMRLPHHACPDCGSYNGQTVLDIEEKK
jgi:large subunit ribosomal protein L32